MWRKRKGCFSLPLYGAVFNSPRFKRKITSALFAISLEWVTITAHLFILCTFSSRMSIIAIAVSSSRLPVGSSVNCTPIPLCLENRGFNGMYICVLCTFSLYVKSKQIFSFQKSPLAFIY